MPRIHPEGWRQISASGALARKLDTLAELEDALPDDFAIFHGIHWTRAEADQLLFGGIDFIVVGPSGRLLLIEQITGFLDETPDGLVKRHIRTRRNVSVDLARNADHLRARLTSYLDAAPPALDLLLYCPDYTVHQPGSAGLDPSRIVDAARREQLPAIVCRLLTADDRNQELLSRLERFFVDSLELVPEASALVGRAHALYTRLAGGLAEWGRRIDMTPFRLRVTGTAGSGKTQLALAALRDAIAAGRKPLYVCYNRPLADHIAQIAPPGAEVATYHQLCDRVLRMAGAPPDFSAPQPFDTMAQAFQRIAVPEGALCDELIIDEGQDFTAEWCDSLLRLLRPNGRAWWLEDPMQNLYERPEVELPGWVRLRSDRNYRSPADIVALLNRSLAPPQPLEAGSPMTGSEIEISTWESDAELMDRTRRAITRAIGLGFRRDHIALITFRGRERSRFTPLTRIGQHTLRTFTGRYDLVGSPEYTRGDFLIDSVYRFKGQAAPCVIFTEIDFETLDTRAARKLFVGATRAGMKLIMVMSQRAAKALGTPENADEAAQGRLENFPTS